MSHTHIEVRGARENNLKNIDVDIPRDQLVVLTGLSGSGKSSLAFDTIFAEGQRRYVESLSSYARQFLGQMEKPSVDSIEGLSPAISIDQKSTSNNPRSTVGTVTEIYDYLRLLYAASACRTVLMRQSYWRQTLDQILDQVLTYPEGTRLLIMAPVVRERKGSFAKLDELRSLAMLGFEWMVEQHELDEDIELNKRQRHNIRYCRSLVMRDGIRSRLADSVEIALNLADKVVEIEFQVPNPEEEGKTEYYSNLVFTKFACPDCNISLGEIDPPLFSFNNPQEPVPTVLVWVCLWT